MPKDVSPATLRDTLFIWVFATANVKTFQGIANGTTSGDDLRKKLESQGNIRSGNGDNINTCNTVCAEITANPDAFITIQQAFLGIDVLAGSWSGSEIHPRVEELQKAFIDISGEIRSTRKQPRALKGRQTKRYGSTGTARPRGRK